MTDENINEVYALCSDYSDVPEKAKIASLADIWSQGYTLSVSSYIEKAVRAAAPPAEVRKSFFDALERARAAEDKFKSLLVEAGYIHE